MFATLRTAENDANSGKLQLTIYTPVREVRTCPHRKNIGWRLHLQAPDKLPELNSVHALCLEDEATIDPLTEDKSLLKVDLRMLIDLSVKLPHLEFLGCKLGVGGGWTTELSSEAARHYSRDWAGPCRDTRHDFAKALETATLPSTLRQAQLDFLNPLSAAEWIDQSQKVPNMVSPVGHDPFSSSLRLLSRQLHKLELRVVADATLFWPAGGTAFWPNLESISILFHISSPSGRWYFEGLKGRDYDTDGFEVTSASYPPLQDTSDDENWDEDADDNGLDTSTIAARKFRVQPNDDILVPFLTAFGKATSRMPALKEARLWTLLRWDAGELDGYEDYDSRHSSEWSDGPLVWGLTYRAPTTSGSCPSPGEPFSALRKLWWVTARWRPSDGLRNLFDLIGDQNTEMIDLFNRNYGQMFAVWSIFDHVGIFDSGHSDSP